MKARRLNSFRAFVVPGLSVWIVPASPGLVVSIGALATTAVVVFVRSDVSDRVRAWLQDLADGKSVEFRVRRVALTREGIEWRLPRQSVEWGEIDNVRPQTHEGILRIGRWVSVKANGKRLNVQCSKRDFGDVLATCAEMTRRASRSAA